MMPTSALRGHIDMLLHKPDTISITNLICSRALILIFQPSDSRFSSISKISITKLQNQLQKNPWDRHHGCYHFPGEGSWGSRYSRVAPAHFTHFFAWLVIPITSPNPHSTNTSIQHHDEEAFHRKKFQIQPEGLFLIPLRS